MASEAFPAPALAGRFSEGGNRRLQACNPRAVSLERLVILIVEPVSALKR